MLRLRLRVVIISVVVGGLGSRLTRNKKTPELGLGLHPRCFEFVRKPNKRIDKAEVELYT